MNAFGRILKWLFGGLTFVAAILVAMFAYYVYTPEPAAPHLTGSLASGAIEVGGEKRTYLVYAPKELPAGSPLVVVMHGSGGDGAKIRVQTGYGFERLADEHRFAVVYPDAYEGFWNGCNTVGDYSANTLNIDDVGFLTAVVDRLTEEIGSDPGRVFAAGVSRGGHMAFRLAIEAPLRFRAVAAVAANLPAPENFKCTPAARSAASVLIMNGTSDPLNPFHGGEVTLFGMYKRGNVLSSRASAEYFAGLAGVTGAPEIVDGGDAGAPEIERLRWSNDAGVEAELVAVRGGGHVLPQPYRRAPRILGPTAKDVDGPMLIWSFFERQRPHL